MKKMMILLSLVTLLGLSVPAVFADIPDPWDYETLEWITENEIQGEYELLAITQDGYLIIRYNGKIYIFEPKKK